MSAGLLLHTLLQTCAAGRMVITEVQKLGSPLKCMLQVCENGPEAPDLAE